jgi:hypothetical protein
MVLCTATNSYMAAGVGEALHYVGATGELWYCVRLLTATWQLVLGKYCVLDVGSACWDVLLVAQWVHKWLPD